MGRWRVCAGRGCATRTTTTYCTACAAGREQARGSRHERGYGTDHYRIRDDLLKYHMPGTPCRVCGQGMWVEQGLDAAHSEDLRDNPEAKADHLEHAACNRGWRAGEHG